MIVAAMSGRSVLLRGGRIVDGEKTAIETADLRIDGDRIREIGRLSPNPGELVRDLDGLMLAPGWIDTHTHADCVAFLGSGTQPLALANLRQGVTTQVCGNCGYSPFPVVASRRDELTEHLLPALGPGTRTFPTIRAWATAVEDSELHTNLVPLVGHGTLRASALGFEDRAATEVEVSRMEQLLDDCLQNGAFGVSTGLIYSPGMFATTEELVRLARVAARYGAPYASHMRNETDQLQQAVHEAIEIGRQSKAGVHISHHKAAGRVNWGSTEQTLGQIDRARDDGLDITLDVYPYTAGSTALQALLPPWVQQGGTDVMLKRLGERAIRQRIAAELLAPNPTWQNLVSATGWDGIVVAAAPAHRDAEGHSLAQLAELANRDPVDVIIDLLVSERANVTIILHMMDERDVRNVLRWPRAMIGSDGILQPGRPHPRLAGTFARILGTYVRQAQLWPLPEAIRRMTSLAAQRFNIPDRGRIAPGMAADLVAFDPERISDRATYENPLAPPEGVVHVVVNGEFAIDDGEITGRAAGRVLRRTGSHGL
jgi:N-acyl-D-amino-acid deacylase